LKPWSRWMSMAMERSPHASLQMSSSSGKKEATIPWSFFFICGTLFTQIGYAVTKKHTMEDGLGDVGELSDVTSLASGPVCGLLECPTSDEGGVFFRAGGEGSHGGGGGKEQCLCVGGCFTFTSRLEDGVGCGCDAAPVGGAADGLRVRVGRSSCRVDGVRRRGGRVQRGGADGGNGVLVEPCGAASAAGPARLIVHGCAPTTHLRHTSTSTASLTRFGEGVVEEPVAAERREPGAGCCSWIAGVLG
jgi:hypothetical protein